VFPATELESHNNYCPFFWLSIWALALVVPVACWRAATTAFKYTVFKIKNSRVYTKATNTYRSTQYWNQARINILVQSAKGRQMISEAYARPWRTSAPDLKAWLWDKEVFLQDLPENKRKMYEDDSPDWEELLRIHHYHVYVNTSDLQKEYDRHSLGNTGKVFLGMGATLIIFLALMTDMPAFALFTGVTLVVSVLATTILVIAGLAFTIPYLRGAYHKVCPEIEWKTK